MHRPIRSVTHGDNMLKKRVAPQAIMKVNAYIDVDAYEMRAVGKKRHAYGALPRDARSMRAFEGTLAYVMDPYHPDYSEASMIDTGSSSFFDRGLLMPVMSALNGFQLPSSVAVGENGVDAEGAKEIDRRIKVIGVVEQGTQDHGDQQCNVIIGGSLTIAHIGVGPIRRNKYVRVRAPTADEAMRIIRNRVNIDPINNNQRVELMVEEVKTITNLTPEDRKGILFTALNDSMPGTPLTVRFLTRPV